MGASWLSHLKQHRRAMSRFWRWGLLLQVILLGAGAWPNEAHSRKGRSLPAPEPAPLAQSVTQDGGSSYSKGRSHLAPEPTPLAQLFLLDKGSSYTKREARESKIQNVGDSPCKFVRCGSTCCQSGQRCRNGRCVRVRQG